jgi:branched-chain amino acid transport system permease protein
MAAGKNVLRYRLEAFVLGSAIMGVGGALYAHFIGFISPEAFDPLFTTFVVWVMLIAGGSGNNKGALLGAFLIWAVWSGTQFATGYLPVELTARAGALRVLLVGVLLQVILLARPQGLLPERPPRPLPAQRTESVRRSA